METTEDFVRRLQVCVRVAPPDSAYFDRDKMAPMIEADRTATRLAAKLEALDECEAWLTARGVYPHARRITEDMLDELRAKCRASAR